MTTSTLYHTQGIRGFQYKKTERKGQTEYYYVISTASQLSCPHCGSRKIRIQSTNEFRRIRALPIGLKKRLSVYR